MTSPAVVPHSSSQTTCPASNTITWVTEPIPQSFNYLAPSGDSTFMVGALEYMSLAPFPLQPNGSLYWADSLTNWISPNSNYTQWTFHIAPGMTWSNGTAVNASDIATWLSPSYALNPQYDFVGLHNEVTGVKIVNSDTATVILNQSDAQLPNRIGTYYYAPLVSPSDVARGPADPLFTTPAVADGPWYLANYTSGGTQALMLPNPYWPGQKPTACAIDLIFVENSAQLVPYLVSGTTDFAGPMAFGNLAALAGHPNIHTNSFGGDFGSFMMYNITQYPYNMTQFRQALAYGINTSQIMQQSVFGYGVAANNAQGGMPDTYGSYNPNQQQYAYNVTTAINLLHSIGFTGGGAAGVPLAFPNGTKYSVTLYTDTNKAWDPSLELGVANYLTNLGITVQTQTLTSANLAADYASNAFNIQNNLVVYSSGGAQYFSPWVSAQQDCNVYGTPGCFNWFAQNAPDGLPHEEWPPFADAWYQSNLTAINNTPATNITGQIHYLGNIQLIRAEYLPVIMLGYPAKIFAYNTAKWTSWPSYYTSNEGQMNETMFGALVPAGSVTSTSTTSATSSVATSSSSGSTSSTSTGSVSTSSQATTSSSAATSLSTATTQSGTSTSTSSAGTIELIAAVVIVVLIIGGIAAYMMRRKPPAAGT
ncbi:MAG: ABC transporter substrate-binding protein [Nitrososphaerales archaeon]